MPAVSRGYERIRNNNAARKRPKDTAEQPVARQRFNTSIPTQRAAPPAPVPAPACTSRSLARPPASRR
jgi:hypothetical protein